MVFRHFDSIKFEIIFMAPSEEGGRTGKQGKTPLPHPIDILPQIC